MGKNTNFPKRRKKNWVVATQIILTALLCLALFATGLSLYAYNNELHKELSKLTVQLNNEKSETVCLESAIENKLTMNNVEKIVVEEYGMTKTKASVIFLDVEDFKEQYNKEHNISKGE